jgi:hypothetical protein
MESLWGAVAFAMFLAAHALAIFALHRVQTEREQSEVDEAFHARRHASPIIPAE